MRGRPARKRPVCLQFSTSLQGRGPPEAVPRPDRTRSRRRDTIRGLRITTTGSGGDIGAPPPAPGSPSPPTLPTRDGRSDGAAGRGRAGLRASDGRGGSPDGAGAVAGRERIFSLSRHDLRRRTHRAGCVSCLVGGLRSAAVAPTRLRGSGGRRTPPPSMVTYSASQAEGISDGRPPPESELAPSPAAPPVRQLRRKARGRTANPTRRRPDRLGVRLGDEHRGSGARRARTDLYYNRSTAPLRERATAGAAGDRMDHNRAPAPLPQAVGSVRSARTGRSL